MDTPSTTSVPSRTSSSSSSSSSVLKRRFRRLVQRRALTADAGAALARSGHDPETLTREFTELLFKLLRSVRSDGKRLSAHEAEHKLRMWLDERLERMNQILRGDQTETIDPVFHDDDESDSEAAADDDDDDREA